jgi:hypothetical protein
MGSGRTKVKLLLALQRILRSLAHLLIRVGVPLEDFSKLVRELYVETAIRDYRHNGIPSRRRIAAFTGLTCRQVNEYIDEATRTIDTDSTLTALLIEVLHKWHTVSRYGGPYGIPLELEFETPANRCIRSLVCLADAKANPQTVLEELLRSGAIVRAGDRRFRPISRFLMSTDPASPRLIERFRMRGAQLTETLEYNSDPSHPEKRLDRHVYADRGLPLDLVPAFESYARTKTTDFLLELDNWLAVHTESDGNGPESARLVEAGVNVFQYIEPPSIQKEPLSSLVSQTKA